MRVLRCIFGRHESSIIYGETLALCGCRDCGYVESWWPVLRPEASGAKQIVQAEAQAREARARAVIAEREERASRMGRRLTIVRPA